MCFKLNLKLIFTWMHWSDRPYFLPFSGTFCDLVLAIAIEVASRYRINLNCPASIYTHPGNKVIIAVEEYSSKMSDTNQRAESQAAGGGHRGQNTGPRDSRSPPPSPPAAPVRAQRPSPPAAAPVRAQRPSPPAAAAVRAQRPYRLRSVIWRHCTKRMVTTAYNNTTLTCCNYCTAHWNLYGSTGVALQHLRIHHPEVFIENENEP